MPSGFRVWRATARQPPPRAEVARRLQVQRVLGAALALGLAGACGRADLPDTATVVVAEGTADDQQWSLEGRRTAGQPCLSLVIAGPNRAAAGRCGIWRSPLRHLDPVSVPVGSRVVVFSPLPGRTRRVRVDTGDGAIRLESARAAAGFPDRFFVLDLELGNPPLAVRTFADGGRAVVT